MAEKTYKVLDDKKYTGKHKVYTAGATFKESEIFGSIDAAIKAKKVELVTFTKATSKASK